MRNSFCSCAGRRLGLLFGILFVGLAVPFMIVQLMPLLLTVSSAGAQTGRASRGNEKVFVEEDKTYLWGGDKRRQRFDISTFLLNPAQLHYGLGREAFPALIEPEFVTATRAADWLKPDARVLAVKIGDEVKAYPIDLLLRHEVVNDTVGGQPVFVAYCVLADLGAVYNRELDDETLTFAVSGYTYADPKVWDGRDAFVLWDRETESLWWPPIGKAVSGPLIHQPLKLLDEQFWSQTTWGSLRQKYPGALVLKPGQDLARPVDWPRLQFQRDAASPATAPAIAPRWGRNEPF